MDPRQATLQAEMLRQRAKLLQGQTGAPQGKMVGNQFVAPSWAEQLLPVVNSLLSQYEGNKANELATQADTAYKQQAQDWMASAPQPTTQQVPAGTGMTGGMDEQDFTPPTTKTVQPTRAQVLQHAMQAVDNPYTKELSQQYMLDQMVKAPERELQRETNKAMLEDKQAEARFLAKERQDNQRWMQQQQLQVQQMIASGNQEIRRQGLQLQRELAAQRAAIAAANRADKNSKLSSKDMADLDAHDAMVMGLNEAVSQMEGVKRKEGTAEAYGKGVVQEFVPGGETLVAATRAEDLNKAILTMTYITDEIRHGRFGAALTASEKASAGQYLPTPYDKPERRADKAKQLQWLLNLNRTRLKAKEGGRTDYMSIKAPEGSSAPAAARPASPAAPASKKEDDVIIID